MLPAITRPERPRLRLFGPLLAVLVAGSLGLDDPPPAAPPPSDPAPASVPTSEPETMTPERVHLWVDRYEEIGGEVVEEDHELIVIRTPAGEIRTFPRDASSA